MMIWNGIKWYKTVGIYFVICNDMQCYERIWDEMAWEEMI
jgi:hypothetical protein